MCCARHIHGGSWWDAFVSWGIHRDPYPPDPKTHTPNLHPHPSTCRTRTITDLATLFYEWGWGQSFHFANRHRDETFAQSIKRHEYYLASRLVSLCGRPVVRVGLVLGVVVCNAALWRRFGLGWLMMERRPCTHTHTHPYLPP